MATEQQTTPHPEQGMTAEEKIEQLRELYADAPEVGRTALEGGGGSLDMTGDDPVSEHVDEDTMPGSVHPHSVT